MQSVVGDVVTPQGCGEALKAARERAGLSVQEISQRLKMPVRVIQSLEAGQWDQSGGVVFVRGQLRSYGRLLKVDVEPFLQQAETVVARPAELVSRAYRRGIPVSQATLDALYGLEMLTWAPTSERSRAQAGFTAPPVSP